jgi:thymidylate synthase (FAD)
MRRVEPKVFLIGETRIVEDGLTDYLRHVGAEDWQSNAPSDAERIIEVYGRICYRSWKPGMNPNVKKVRKDNKEYLENVKQERHGSLFEHAAVNFIFADVSRVFTHELVRHRIGVAISQESLRYVRLDDLGQWLPTVIREDEHAMTIFARTFEELEQLQRELGVHFELDKEGTSFHKKKTVTSAMRRIAPIGLATTIGWSANMRALRHVIEMRTNPAAEEEIRLVFGEVGKIAAERYPNLFGDYEIEMVDGLPWYKTPNSKV